MTGIDRAVMIAGTQKKLAIHLGVSQSAVQVWQTMGYVPKKRGIQLQGMFGIPLHELLKPVPQNKSESHMRIRDQFAAAALQGMFANPNMLIRGEFRTDNFQAAWEAADRMMKEREL